VSHGVIHEEVVTPNDDDDPERAERRRRKRKARRNAPKERVLHTRVPAVLEDELKRLAKGLRVPVSNVVRAILEDAVDAVDAMGGIAEDELVGFADRLQRQRDHLRDRVARRGEEATDEPEVEESDEADEAEETDEEPSCPPERPDALDGVFGFQPLVLASDAECSVCGAPLGAGSDAHRALFDDPTERVLVGPRCRLLPDKG